MRTAHKFSPGEVTPEQLEQYRQKYEAAQKKKQIAYDRYQAAYYVYADVSIELRAAEAVYVWAQRGMVEVGEE